MSIYRVKKMVVLLLVTILLLTNISLGTVFYKESISVGDTAIGTTANSINPELKKGIFSCEGGNVRWWMDGTNPTSSEGHLLYQDDYLVISGINNLRNLKFIRTGSNTTTIRASYED